MKRLNQSAATVMAIAILCTAIHRCHSAPFVTRTENGVDVNVWPFFNMHLARELRGLVLNIDVLSGMVKVNLDRKQGQRPMVDVSVFGIGSNGGGGGQNANKVPIDDIDSELGEMKAPPSASVKPKTIDNDEKSNELI